jgi:hypothetical protein
VQKGLNSEVIKTNYLCFENYVILVEKTFIQLKEKYIKNTYDARKYILVMKGR